MFAILVYDIPSDSEGTKRRNKIYKLCSKYGYHVQSSVFELDTDYSQLVRIEHEVENVINKEFDSVRVYRLGKERTDANVCVLGKHSLCESDDSCFII